ncbi:MAG: ParB N-terminal domain-containing protein [Arcanobacterium sp.]|nr:ParB N-terminal domain-containing protein [Arcanobacterium sp.]
MKREKVSLERLLLWQANPRVSESSSQKEELNKIYDSGSGVSESLSRRQLVNLSESISKNGFLSEIHPILVTCDNNGNYIVKDGNRRVAALKLLQNPESYQTFLQPKHFTALQKMKDEAPETIDKIEVIIFSDNEEEELKETIARLHQGPLEGVGTVPWGTEAKDRFFKVSEYSDDFDTPFEKQFGTSLTNYLGGTGAITTRRRIFNYKDVKDFLGINAKEDFEIDLEVLDKIKKVADLVKAQAEKQGMQLSRFKKEHIEAALAANTCDPIDDFDSMSDEEKDSLADGIAQATFNDFIKNWDKTSGNLIGGRFMNPTLYDKDSKNFNYVNYLIAGLSEFGKLSGQNNERRLKVNLFSPLVRVIFELTLLGLRQHGHISNNKAIDTNHKGNVDAIVEKMRDDRFINYASKKLTVFSGFKELKSYIDTTKFGEVVQRSHLTSHKAGQLVNTDEILNSFEYALSFCALAQCYVTYKDETLTDPAGQN